MKIKKVIFEGCLLVAEKLSFLLQGALIPRNLSVQIEATFQ